MISVLLAAALTAAPSKIHPRPHGRGKAYYHKTAIAPYVFHNTITLQRVEKNDSEQGAQNAAWDAIADIKDRAKRKPH